MAAMMPTVGGGSARSANPYEQYDNPVEDDLIEADDGSDPSFLHKLLTC